MKMGLLLDENLVAGKRVFGYIRVGRDSQPCLHC